jgi:hypothetical protein
MIQRLKHCVFDSLFIDIALRQVISHFSASIAVARIDAERDI